MIIDREEARRIARLARLDLTEEQLDRMALDMTEILDYVDQLARADAGDATRDGEGLRTPLREDVTHDAALGGRVEANAPAWRDGFFVVPRVIGE